jgi:hypothetical protein
MLKRTHIAAGITLLAAGSVTVDAVATEQLKAVGRLSCVVEPRATGEPKAGRRDLSCRYEPIAGTASNYMGTVVRFSGPPLVDANLVLIWSVRAPRADIAPDSLSGRYIASPGTTRGPSATKIGALKRDGVVPIELQAVTPTTGSAQQRTLVLELNLASVRA